MAKKESIIKKITQWKVIIAIQIIATLILVAFIFKLGVLPIMHASIVVVILVLLSVGTFFLMKPSTKKGKGKARNVIGKLVSLLLSVILLIGSLMISRGDLAIGNITGANKQTVRISMIVMKDSKYKQISDLQGKTIEVNSNDEPEKMAEAIKELNKVEPTIKTTEVDDFIKMADDLYDDKTPAIYVNENAYAFLEANHQDFVSETRVIYSYEIEEEVKDISTKVDVTDKAFTIYISGIDTTGPVSTVSRTDVNMLVTVNPKTRQILMTSIPRDYYVTLANKGKKDKLTHSGIGGVENSVKTLKNFLGIDINYYARVNFTSLVTMVDALNGITVNSPVAFKTRHGGYQIAKGNNQMNGDKALGFVRERYGLANGDNDRVKNQQRVLTAMLQKMMSPAIIRNYSGVLNSIEGSFETNMSSKEITDLIQMQISDMSSWSINQIQLTGSGKNMTGGAYMPNNHLYYMIPNQKSVDKCVSLIKQMQEGKRISVTE